MQVLADDDLNKKPEDYNPIELQKLTRYSVDSFVDPNYRGWFNNLFNILTCMVIFKYFFGIIYFLGSLTNPKKR